MMRKISDNPIFRPPGVKIFELGGAHLEVPSHVSRVKLSLKLTKLCVYDVLLWSWLQILPNLLNNVTFPLNVSPVEKSF